MIQLVQNRVQVWALIRIADFIQAEFLDQLQNYGYGCKVKWLTPRAVCNPAVSRPSHAVSGRHAARAGITKPLHCVFPIRCKNERPVVTARCLVQRYGRQKCSKVKEVTCIMRCRVRPSASLRRYFTSTERMKCGKQTARCRAFI